MMIFNYIFSGVSSDISRTGAVKRREKHQ